MAQKSSFSKNPQGHKETIYYQAYKNIYEHSIRLSFS